VALDANALVSVTEARTYLQVDATDKPTTALLEQVIGGLSLRVLQHTGQTYINPVAADGKAERIYELNTTSARELVIDNCRQLTLIEATATPNDAGSWVEVEADSYITEPLGEPVAERVRFLEPALLPAIGTGWGLLGLHASPQSMPSSTPWPNQVRAELESRTYVRVTAKFGYGPDLATVPANVKLAVLMWLQNIHKRDQAFFSESAKVTAKIAMPEDVKEMLEGEAAKQPSVAAV
jgi:hypothetical protein